MLELQTFSHWLTKCNHLRVESKDICIRNSLEMDSIFLMRKGHSCVILTLEYLGESSLTCSQFAFEPRLLYVTVWGLAIISFTYQPTNTISFFQI